MNLPRVEKHLEKEFHVSWYIIIYKLILGLIEFISGLALGLLGKQLLRMYTFQVTKELSEEPHDLLARFSERIVPNIFTHDTFLILYLLLLGAAKIAGAIGLMYKQNWGVDLLVGLTVVLFPFQVVELLLHPSFFNLLYIFLGLLIALYLVEFHPKAWISRVVLKIDSGLKNNY